MKKLILILVVLAMAAPLYAQGRIQFSATDNGNGSCTIVYDANDTFGIAPVAMALTVKVTEGNPIKSVTLEDENDFFEIFMDAAYSIETDPCDPCSYEYGTGTPIADPCGPGEVSLTTHGNHFVLSFGGLGGETAKTKAPPMSGTITLYADAQEPPAGVGDTVGGTIELNALRGGVIGTDTEPMETNLDDPAKSGPMGFTISECVRSDSASYNAWYGKGKIIGANWTKPICWCYRKHCKGDADGKLAGPFRVGSPDLLVLVGPDALNRPMNKPTASLTQETICADIDHLASGPFRVASADLTKLTPTSNGLLNCYTLPNCFLNQADPTVPKCPADWDTNGTDDYNFWINGPGGGFSPPNP